MKSKAFCMLLVGIGACLAVALASDRRYGEIPAEDAPLEKQVEWYLKARRIPIHLPIDYESEGQEAAGRIRRDMMARADEYFPVLVEKLDRAESAPVEALAIQVLASPIFLESHREEVREILRGYVTGERKPRHDLGEGHRPIGAAVAHYPKVARGPEDAWELLPHVETEYGSTAIRAISKIADPSIIPALEEAVRRRTEKFPERFRNVEENLSRYLAEFTDKIRARYPNWSEDNRKGPGSPSPAEQDAAPPSEAEAEEAQEPPEAGESSEAGEASKGSLALWTALVAGALAVAALEARRRAGKR